MPEFDDTVAFLAIEEKPNSFYPIEIKDLNIANNQTCLTLREIDAFTSTFEEEMLRNSIKEANVIPDNATNAPLVVVYTDYGVKKKTSVITKEFLESYNIYNMIAENFSNKDFINHALNKIRKLNVENGIKSDLEAALKNANFADFFDLFDTLPYTVQRNFYLYIAKGIKMRENKSRILEKPNKEED